MPQPLPRIAVAPAENRPYRVAMPRTSKRPLPRHVLRIGERRRELGLTQEELARMAGFSTSLMAKIERGAVDPKTLSAQYLVGLARALGLTLTALVFISMDRHTPDRFANFEARVAELPEVLECLLITGQDVYRQLKFESGVQRVKRVPVTEAGGRIHTSTVTVAVLQSPSASHT